MRLSGRLSSGSLCMALAVAVAVVTGCGESRGVPTPGNDGELPDQEVGDFVLTETDQGTPVWTLYARHAATYSVRNLVVARAVRVDFFDDSGDRTSELTAHEGEINQRTRDMTARGNVVILTSEGTRMTTQELRFLNLEQKIISPVEQLVRVERSGDVLTGYGFESDPELKHFEFKKKVRATVRTKSGGIIAPESGP